VQGFRINGFTGFVPVLFLFATMVFVGWRYDINGIFV